MIPFKLVEPSEQEILAMQPYIVYKDAAILAAAKKANVDFLVTLDRKHMISKREELARQIGIKIVLPSELLAFLRHEL